MQTLVLFGDSWGCGEWCYQDHSPPFVSHPGLTEYLGDQFVTKNFSREGASLWQTAYAVRNYLENLRAMNSQPPLLVLIQTDAARQAQADKFQVDYDEIYRSGQDIKDIYTKLLEIWYIKLQFMAEQYDTVFYMSGGLTDLDMDSMKLYPRLRALCPSWIQLCEPAIKSSTMPLIMSHHVLKYLHDNHDARLMTQMMDWLDESFLSLQTLLESPWMGPSYGDYHPSRLAHQRLSDHIKKFFLEEST